MRTIHVSASGSYDIIIEDNILKRSGEFVRAVVSGRRAVLVTDDIVEPLYSGTVEKSLIESGFEVSRFVIPNGEASKNAGNFVKLLEFAASHGLSRKDVIIALGGGVVGDLAGFAASAYMRGTAFVQLPTTLLAAVDSSVGGKTAIDLEAGKNLAGAFYQPKLVLCDCTVFDTLPEEIFADGMAEVIKYGAIADRELWGWLKEPLDGAKIEKIVARCVEIKRDVVEKDEYDTGLRQILNFGHTIGHAIEKCSGYTVSHGRAVAAGMAVMAEISDITAETENGKADGENGSLASDMKEMLKRHKLPYSVQFTADELCGPICSDKKGDGDSVNLILLNTIGDCFIRNTAITDIKKLLLRVL